MFNKRTHILVDTGASVIVVIIDRTQFFGKAPNNQFQSNLHLQVLMQTQFLEYLGLQHHVGTIVMWHRYYAKLKIDPEYLKRVTFLQDYLHRSNLSKIYHPSGIPRYTQIKGKPMKHTPGLTHNFPAQLLQYYRDNSPDANKNQQPNDEQFRKCTKCKQITGKVL